MKVAYIHNLPLEYYPPATNTVNALSDIKNINTRVYTTHNLKNRPEYKNKKIKIFRQHLAKPSAAIFNRFSKSIWWHIRTAFSLLIFKPDAIIYVEPHSAISVYIYYRYLFGKAKLLIHHHEYYDEQDYYKRGMRIPRLGSYLEEKYLFHHATWISQTNNDRLELIRNRNPKIPQNRWNVFPNYPPTSWSLNKRKSRIETKKIRIIYIGSASFHDTYIKEAIQWAANNEKKVDLHISGYNIDNDIWQWLQREHFSNITFSKSGYKYDDIPKILSTFNIGLVLYKGNTKNFIYNIPNKVFEYLACNLDVLYPQEMSGMNSFSKKNSINIKKVNFKEMDKIDPEALRTFYNQPNKKKISIFTSEKALSSILKHLKA